LDMANFIRTGYTWALSRAAVPAIVDYGSNDEAILLAQWRHQYVDGAAFSRPCCVVNAISFGYLAYQGQSSSAIRHPCRSQLALASISSNRSAFPLHLLYVVAALATASGVPWALTALRRTNGALSIRTKRLSGSYKNSNSQPLCITYASGERASFDREGKDPKFRTSKALVNRWRWHNDLRTALLVCGTVIGAIAVVLDR